MRLVSVTESLSELWPAKVCLPPLSIIPPVSTKCRNFSRCPTSSKPCSNGLLYVNIDGQTGKWMARRGYLYIDEDMGG